jgi:hypothetical protein
MGPAAPRGRAYRVPGSIRDAVGFMTAEPTSGVALNAFISLLIVT